MLRYTLRDTLPWSSGTKFGPGYWDGLELVAFLGAGFGEGHGFGAVLGHEDGVLELGGEAAVFGTNGPTVALALHGILDASVDHRLDGENEAGLEALPAGFRCGNVGDSWRLMEIAADAVADIFLDDGEAELAGVADDGVADVGDAAVGLEVVDSQPERVERALHDATGEVGGRADDKGLAGIAVPTVDDGSKVDVDDIAFLEHVVAGDAVADDVVDAGAAAGGEGAGLAVIAQLGRHVAVVAGVGFDELIDFTGGQAGADNLADLVHQRSVEAAGLAHGLAFVGSEQETAAVVEHDTAGLALNF
jgi:hypothetical protein